eukprot:6459579-Amphidinium_carterae.1
MVDEHIACGPGQRLVRVEVLGDALSRTRVGKQFQTVRAMHCQRAVLHLHAFAIETRTMHSGKKTASTPINPQVT